MITNLKNFLFIITSLAGLIYSSIQIYNYFLSTKDYYLVAKASYSKFAYPPDYLNSLDRFNNEFKPESLEKILPNSKFDPYDFYRFYTESNFNKTNDNLKEIDSYWKFEIINQGNKEVKNINLDLPFDGYYSITNPRGEQVNSSFNRNISIGTLRPSNKTEIKIWSNGYISSSIGSSLYFSDPDDIKLTYSEGIINIKYEYPNMGIGSWFYRNGNKILTWFFIIFIGITILQIIFNSKALFNFNNKEKNKPKVKSSKNH